MLLPARHQRLLEPGTDAFATVEAQMPGSLRQAEDALRLGRAKPLEFHRQRTGRKLRLDPHRLLVRLDIRGRRDVDLRNDTALREVKPVVVLPDAFLQRGFAAERAAPLRRHGPAAEMRVIRLPVRRLDILPVPCPLQHRVRCILGRDEMQVRMHLVGPFYRTRAGHGHGVIVTGTPFGGRQVVPAVPLEEVRTLHEAERAAGEDVADWPLQSLRLRVPFLQQDAVEGRTLRRAAIAFGPMVPLHVHEPLATVIVVEERRIEAG